MTTPAVQSLKGTGYNQISAPRLNPQQQQLFSQVFGALSPHLGGAVKQLGGLAAGGSPEQWAQLEAPALRQFGDLQGSIAARFSGLGSGARQSSGFQHAQTSAAQQLAESLQSQRMGIQQNAMQQLMQLYGSLIGTDTMNQGFLPKKRSWWEELLPSFGGGLSSGVGTLGSLYGAKNLGLLG